MPTFTVLKARRFEREWTFDKDPAFLGRDEGNDLVLNDGSISRVHAKFVKDPSGWSVADLGSTNGVYLNNAKVDHMPVRDGDVLVMGDYTFFVRSAQVTNLVGESGQEAAYQTLESLCLLTRKFMGPISHTEMLEAMIDALLPIFQAERGFLLLRDSRTGQLMDPTIVRHMDPRDSRLQISKTVATQVMQSKNAMVITDVEADEALKGVDSIAAESVRSIICGPLIRSESEVRGVVYLDSRVKARLFSARDLGVLDTFLSHASALLGAAEERDGLRKSTEAWSEVAREVQRGEGDPDRIIGRSPGLAVVLDQVRDLASTDVTGLITGESGTGKELVAKAIHFASNRAKRPFVAVNCMALSRELVESELFGHEKGAFSGAVARKVGKFELADGGTLFLDEIGELSLDVQVKLLRVLQERKLTRVGGNEELEMDIRLVTATNKDLPKLVTEGKFREDLYYRINVFEVRLPPLRERREDVPDLLTHFIRMFNLRMGKRIEGVHPEALERLVAYDWPGNIREVRNVVERAFVVEKSRQITSTSLPFGLPASRVAAPASAGTTSGASAPSPAEGAADIVIPEGAGTEFDRAREQFERAFIVQSLRKNGGNIALTARETGLPRRTLYRRLEKYGIDPKDLLSAESLDTVKRLKDEDA